jgi:cullin-5
LQITFANAVGRFDVDVTTFQMAVLFAWNQRPVDKISYENLRLATELPDPELRRTLWVCKASFCTFQALTETRILCHIMQITRILCSCILN